MDRLTQSWLHLLALTTATTVLAGIDSRLAAVGLLALAWLKARTILGGFLHLRAAPGWLGAASLPLALWLAAIAALCLLRPG